MDDADRRLAALLRRLALHRGDEDLAALRRRLLADLETGLTDPLGDLRDELALDAANHLCAGLLLGEGGDPLQLGGDERPFVLDGLAERLDLGFPPGEALFVGVHLAETAFEPLLALICALFEAGDLGPAFANLSLGLVPTTSRLLLRREEHGLGFLLDGADLIEAPFRVRVVGALHLRNASTCIDERATAANAAATITSPIRATISMEMDWNLGSRAPARPAGNAPVAWGKGPGRDPHRLVDPGRGRPAIGRSFTTEDRSHCTSKGPCLACFDESSGGRLPLTGDGSGGRPGA